MRSLRPCSDSSATPSFPSQPEGKIGLPRANPRGRLWRGPSGLRWVWCNGRGPHLEGRQEPQASSRFRTPMAWPPSCCAVLETRAQDTGWRGVLEPLGWPRCRSFPDAALGGVAHPDCLMGGHVGGLGCPLTALHSWGHLEALGKGGRVAGLPACVLLAGQTPPTTGTCSHTQIHSPLSFSTPVP